MSLSPITIKSNQFNKLLSVNPDTHTVETRPPFANTTAEQWLLSSYKSSTHAEYVRLRNAMTGNYLTYPLYAQRNEMNDCFCLVPVGDCFAIRTYEMHEGVFYYLSVDDYGTPWYAPHHKEWEWFKIEDCSMWLPNVDVDEYADQLRERGYVCFQAILPERADLIKEIIAQMEESDEIDIRTDVQVRVKNILRHPELASLLIHDKILGIAKRFLGETVRCATWSSNTLFPNNNDGPTGLGWHCDYPYHDIPEPWPTNPLGIQILFALDDFHADNGGTGFYPNSHTFLTWPGDDLTEDTGDILECKKGSVLMAHSAWWHTQRKNRSDKSRTALLANFTPGYVVPKDFMQGQYKQAKEEGVFDYFDNKSIAALEDLVLGSFRRGTPFSET
eukprot:TRINITY_DN5538_c0_g1_i2.p1 TRINITY_DN5538_c0_g1~~TRINITY_DN5538_c0_g1_i2.p1  ORF type:complete len:415 (-),score=70.98 TRINITY_DN5538_c0_g1_i2:46-1209(-)